MIPPSCSTKYIFVSSCNNITSIGDISTCCLFCHVLHACNIQKNDIHLIVPLEITKTESFQCPENQSLVLLNPFGTGFLTAYLSQESIQAISSGNPADMHTQQNLLDNLSSNCILDDQVTIDNFLNAVKQAFQSNSHSVVIFLTDHGNSQTISFPDRKLDCGDLNGIIQIANFANKKTLIILDFCSSGAFIQHYIQQYGIPSTQASSTQVEPKKLPDNITIITSTDTDNTCWYTPMVILNSDQKQIVSLGSEFSRMFLDILCYEKSSQMTISDFSLTINYQFNYGYQAKTFGNDSFIISDFFPLIENFNDSFMSEIENICPRQPDQGFCDQRTSEEMCTDRQICRLHQNPDQFKELVKLYLKFQKFVQKSSSFNEEESTKEKNFELLYSDIVEKVMEQFQFLGNDMRLWKVKQSATSEFSRLFAWIQKEHPFHPVEYRSVWTLNVSTDDPEKDKFFSFENLKQIIEKFFVK